MSFTSWSPVARNVWVRLVSEEIYWPLISQRKLSTAEVWLVKVVGWLRQMLGLSGVKEVRDL